MMKINIQGNLLKRTAALENRPYVTSKWTSGNSWYRVWSDGWIEQGGLATQPGSTNFTVNLSKAFTGTNYSITMSAVGDNSLTTYQPQSLFANKTTTSFKGLFYPNNSFYWRAAGF